MSRRGEPACARRGRPPIRGSSSSRGSPGRAAEPIGPLSPLTFSPETVDNQAAIRQALASRAEISAAEAARDTFQQQARLARAQGRPDLAPQFRATSITRGVQDYGVGIGVT